MHDAGGRLGRGGARVLVADDHRTFTDLVGVALRSEAEIEWVGAAHDAANARSMVEQFRPNVVVMDVRLGEDDGLVLTRELTANHPHMRIVVLTAETNGKVLLRAARAGACALLPKGGPFSELLTAIRSASTDSLSIQPALLRALRTEDPEGIDAHLTTTSLTPQEERVLRMLSAGRDVRWISHDLSISVHTSRGYVKSILSKLHAHSQLEAVAAAREAGLIP